MNLTEQWLLIFYVANQVFSAFVQALPAPTTVSSPAYVFFNKFLSLLIADFKSFSAALPEPTLTISKGSIISTTTSVAAPAQPTSEIKP